MLAIATKYGDIERYNVAIFRSVAEGLVMYQFDTVEFKEMAYAIQSRKNQANRVRPQEIYEEMKKYRGYFPAIFNSGDSKTVSSQFYRHTRIENKIPATQYFSFNPPFSSSRAA